MQQAKNLIEMLIARAKHLPDDIAFCNLNDQSEVVSQLTNKQLNERALAIAARLQKVASPSDKILLLFPQGLEFICAFMGAMYSGAIPVIVAPPRDGKLDDIRLRGIQKIVEETNVNVVLTTTQIFDSVVQYFFSSNVLSKKYLLSIEDTSEEQTNSWSMPLITNDSLAYLQRTATEKEGAKFVLISHGNMEQTQERIKTIYKLTSASRSVNWLPHYHYLGLVFGILQPLYCGYRGYIFSQFDFFRNPVSWLEAITKYEINFSGGPNFAFNMCVEQVSDSQRNRLNLSSWNTAYNSAEPIREETLEQFFDKFGCCGLKQSALISMYLLAESAHVISRRCFPQKLLRHESDNHSERSQDGGRYLSGVSCGSPALDTRIVIVNPESQTRCDTLELGEIWIKSASNAMGYWNRQEETAEVFNSYLDDVTDGPYLRTGDLGFIKEGEVHVVSKL